MEFVLVAISVVVAVFVVLLILGGIDNARPVKGWSDAKLMRMHGKLLLAARAAHEAGNMKQVQERMDKASEVEQEIRRRVSDRNQRRSQFLSGGQIADEPVNDEENELRKRFSEAQAYRLGIGVERSAERAYEIMKSLAEAGFLDAQNMIGFMLGDGDGVEQNIDEQYRWWLSAAESGHSVAQANLGVLLATRRGKYLNYAEAEKWLICAAEQGEDFAQERLAQMYSEGEGVERDYEKAEIWCRKAAAQGSESAQHLLGIIQFQKRGDA